MRSKPPERFTVFLDESLDSDSIARALSDAGAEVERERGPFIYHFGTAGKPRRLD